jgi:replication-associated recombination protein RarA
MLGEDNFKTPIRCLIRVVNCAEVTADELDEIVQEVRVHDERLKIIYLDEVHRLRHRRLDERLLKPMEDSQAIWIGSSANIEKNSMDDTSKLDPMFQNRFSFRLKTQLPTIKELVAWLAKRCSEAELQVDEPVREILTIVAKRSQCVPGLALQVLNRAVKSRNRLLTKKIAEEFVFSFDE